MNYPRNNWIPRHPARVRIVVARIEAQLVVEKNIGIQYKPQDPISLSYAIQQLVENPALRAKMSDNARRLAPSFDEAVQHRKFVDIIDQVIDFSEIGNSVKLLQ